MLKYSKLKQTILKLRFKLFNDLDMIVMPLVTFGVITDVQFANCDDKPAGYDRTKTRFYRNSLVQIDKAFEYWKRHSHTVSFVLQLGDVIDGLNSTMNQSLSALELTLSKFESNSLIPTFHTVGNHELYNFDKATLFKLFQESQKRMNTLKDIFFPSKSSCTSPLYYKFFPCKQLKFISLDCFDVSVLGYGSDQLQYVEASKILQSYHHHDIYEKWDCNGELQGLDVRFQQMNGAMGHEQMDWLENELQDSDKNGQKVLVFGHTCLSPDSTDWSCLLWNYKEVMACFHRHHCVIAYLSGHSHNSGYSQDSHGIHYIVFSSIIETPPEKSAFATISVFSDKLEITGQGVEKSYILPYH